MGKRYHGRPYGRVIRNIRERVVPYFTSAAAPPVKTSSASPAPATTTLVWQSGNDGGYQPAQPAGK